MKVGILLNYKIAEQSWIDSKNFNERCLVLPEPLFCNLSPMNPCIAILNYDYVPPKSEDAIIQDLFVTTFLSRR